MFSSWSVFESLVRAAVAMEDPPNLTAVGQPQILVGRHQTGGEDGTEVVHQDLKPTNG